MERCCPLLTGGRTAPTLKYSSSPRQVTMEPLISFSLSRAGSRTRGMSCCSPSLNSSATSVGGRRGGMGGETGRQGREPQGNSGWQAHRAEDTPE